VGPIEKARELYRSATERDPHNIRAMLDWATLEARQGNYQEARKVYERISKVDPNNTIALHTWGLLERRLGNLPKGRELFQRVSQIDPGNMANLQAWGQLENKARNHQEAVRLLERALRYADDDFSKAWIHSDLAYAKGHLRVPKTEVEDHYKTSLALNPNSPQTNHQYADFLFRLGRNYEAEQYQAKARLLGWEEPRRRYQGRR
jgi:tetratricopeptide (TPR) repeat protein